MRTSNGYISLDRAVHLVSRGWQFVQDLNQTTFKVHRGANSCDWYKLNKKTATELKKHLQEIRNQVKIQI